MTLRRGTLVGLSAVAIIGALLVVMGKLPAWQLIFFAVLFIIGIFVERSGYHRPPPANRRLEPTGEIFEDPVSKKTVTVLYDPETGERYYDDAGRQPRR